MKRNNSKKGSSAKQQTIVLVGNTYRRNVNPIPVIAVKLVLAYMLTVGTVMSFINIYAIPFEFGSAIAQVLLFVTAFMPVFIFIKKRYALPAFAVGATIVYFFFHKSINESLILFKDYIFIQLDSRLLSVAVCSRQFPCVPYKNAGFCQRDEYGYAYSDLHNQLYMRAVLL